MRVESWKFRCQPQCFVDFVFADAVLCLGGVSTIPIQAWKDKIKWYLETRYLKDLDRIDGEPM